MTINIPVGLRVNFPEEAGNAVGNRKVLLFSLTHLLLCMLNIARGLIDGMLKC